MSRYPVDSSPDFFTRAALGMEPGATVSGVFSKRLGIGMGTTEDVWCGTAGERTDLVTPERLVIVSDSAQDILGGTGATAVIVQGVGADFVEQVEIVPLDGTTNVTTVGVWMGVNAVFMQGGQSSLANIGTITLISEISGNEQDAILPNVGAGCSSHFTVPLGKTLLLLSINITSEKTDELLVELRLKTDTTIEYVTATQFLVL